MQEDLIEDLHHIGTLYITEIKEKELKDTPDGIDSNGGLWLEINKITKDNAYNGLVGLELIEKGWGKYEFFTDVKG